RRARGSASLQSEAQICKIGRTNPPAQLVRLRGYVQPAGHRFDCSRLYQFAWVNVLTGAGPIAGRVVVKHSAGCLGRSRAVQLQVRGSDDISFVVDSDCALRYRKSDDRRTL